MLDSLIVRVRRSPNLSVIPDATLCEDGTINFTATATDVGAGNNITWRFLGGTAGGRITGATTTASGNPITYNPATDGAAQIRYATADPAGVCLADVDTINIDVFETSTITVPTGIIHVCEGEVATINASYGGGATSIEWTGGNGTFSDNTNPVVDYTPTGLSLIHI